MGLLFGPETIDLLDAYLDARDKCVKERELGEKSIYWDATYGFGKSPLEEAMRTARKNLHDRFFGLATGMPF